MAKSRSLSLVEASASKCGEISTIKCVLLGLLGADRSFSLSTMRRASVSIRLSCKAVTWALKSPGTAAPGCAAPAVKPPAAQPGHGAGPHTAGNFPTPGQGFRQNTGHPGCHGFHAHKRAGSRSPAGRLQRRAGNAADSPAHRDYPGWCRPVCRSTPPHRPVSCHGSVLHRTSMCCAAGCLSGKRHAPENSMSQRAGTSKAGPYPRPDRWRRPDG